MLSARNLLAATGVALSSSPAITIVGVRILDRRVLIFQPNTPLGSAIAESNTYLGKFDWTQKCAFMTSRISGRSRLDFAETAPSSSALKVPSKFFEKASAASF